MESDKNVEKMDSLAVVIANGRRPAVSSLACTEMSGAIKLGIDKASPSLSLGVARNDEELARPKR